MKLYLLTQSIATGYDTYDSCIVAAISNKKAIKIPPSESHKWGDDGAFSRTWPNSPNQVTAKFIGNAKCGTKEGVILSSFNAG